MASELFEAGTPQPLRPTERGAKVASARRICIARRRISKVTIPSRLRHNSDRRMWNCHRDAGAARDSCGLPGPARTFIPKCRVTPTGMRVRNLI